MILGFLSLSGINHFCIDICWHESSLVQESLNGLEVCLSLKAIGITESAEHFGRD